MAMRKRQTRCSRTRQGSMWGLRATGWRAARRQAVREFGVDGRSAALADWCWRARWRSSPWSHRRVLDPVFEILESADCRSGWSMRDSEVRARPQERCAGLPVAATSMSHGLLRPPAESVSYGRCPLRACSPAASGCALRLVQCSPSAPRDGVASAPVTLPRAPGAPPPAPPGPATARACSCWVACRVPPPLRAPRPRPLLPSHPPPPPGGAPRSRPPSANAGWTRLRDHAQAGRDALHHSQWRRHAAGHPASKLWSETREERFFRIASLFRPWPARGEIVALTGHLAENELRGGLTFIERALGIEKAREFYEQESGQALSQSELARRRLTADGYPVPQSHVRRMNDAVRYLLPAIRTCSTAGWGGIR